MVIISSDLNATLAKKKTFISEDLQPASIIPISNAHWVDL